MVEFVAVDHSEADQGNRYFLVGVALEIDNGSDFDDYYFHLVSQFCDKYNLDLAFDIIKTRDILSRIASYDIRDASDALVKGLVQNPALRRIHVCIGWFDKEVNLGWQEESMSGIQFASTYLHQYFPIVTLWRYHRSHRRHGGIPDEAWIDNVQGHITKSWKYVGNEFDMNLVPHGDTTYPSLSTADIIAGHLARTLPRSQPLEELEDAAAGYIIDHLEDSDCYVETESVNEENDDHIVPTYPYSIQGELHFPHPVIFLYDDVFENIDQDVLPETDFHAFARQWAQEEAGCVVNLAPHRLPSIVRSGDRMVYTSDEEPEICTLLQKLNPTKAIDVLDSDTLIAEALND